MELVVLREGCAEGPRLGTLQGPLHHEVRVQKQLWRWKRPRLLSRSVALCKGGVEQSYLQEALLRHWWRQWNQRTTWCTPKHNVFASVFRLLGSSRCSSLEKPTGTPPRKGQSLSPTALCSRSHQHVLTSMHKFITVSPEPFCPQESKERSNPFVAATGRPSEGEQQRFSEAL